MWPSQLSSRWVSWIARIAILCLFIVRTMVVHFSMPLRDDDGAVKPLTLRVAMVMFAFLLLSLMQCAWVGGVGVGVGMVGHWLVRRAASRGPCPS